MSTRINTSRIVTLLILLIALLGTACTPIPTAPAAESPTDGEEASSAEPTPVSLGVGFVPNMQFAPFYVGIEKGLFAEQGIDLAMDYGFENDYLALVGTDEFQFMIGSGDQAVLGRAQGLPVRYVAAWYTRYPVVVFARAEAEITKPADLAHRVVGIPGPFGATYVAYRALLEAGEVSEGDVILESIGFTQAAAVSEYTVEAAVDYAANGPVVLAQEGIATTQIQLDEYLRIPSNGLITNEATIFGNPELVQGMVTGMLNAIQYTLDNPDEAFDIALGYVPEAGGDNLESSRAVFDASLPYWTPQGEDALGTTAAADWQSVAELMQRIELVDTLVPAGELFTSEFVDTP